nr:Rpn family recombination-promoting nuclease/putative transposase [Desulfurispirillum indicum]
MLQHEMPAHIAEVLDFSTLQRIETTYVDDDLRKTYSDRVFLANFRDSDKQAFIYMLFEHKSYPDDWCSLQLLKYMSAQWQKYLRENPQATKLPPIIPLVLYHGEDRWRRKEIIDLLDVSDPESMAPYTPVFDYVLWDVSQMDQRRQIYRPDTSAFLMILHHGRRKSLREILPTVMLLINNANHDKCTTLELLHQFLTYAISVNSDIDDQAIQRSLDEIPEHKEAVMSAVIEKWEARGEARGVHKGQAQILYTQIERRFGSVPPAVHERIAQATEEELSRYAINIFDAKTAFEVVDLSL